MHSPFTPRLYTLLFFCLSAWVLLAQEPDVTTPEQAQESVAADPVQDEGEPETNVPGKRQKVMVIPVSDEGKYMVDQVQAEFIIATLDRAEAENYDHVILKIDTYGGVVFSAREITEHLLRLKIPTTAYVETKAISAGTFIAWACDEIVMESKTTMGDAQMIMQSVEGEIKEAPEKMVTVYRSDWKKSSEAKNRPFAVALGFFQKEVEVLQVGTPDNFSFMTREDYDNLPEAERQPILEVICKKDQLLTLFAEEAAGLGLVTVADDFDTWLTSIGVDPQTIHDADMNLNQQILRFLGANPWIFMILVLIGLNGLYMEIKAPGFGIPGLTALVCFVLVFGSRYFLGTADMFEMVLFVLGLALCLVEIFILPGLGVAGLSGMGLILGSLVLASMPDFGDILPQNDFQTDWMMDMVQFTLAGFTLSLVALVVVAPKLFQSKLAQRHMLPTELTAELGYVMNTVEDKDALLGQTGVVKGGLRPSGKVVLDDGRFLDVVSDGPFINDGQRIRVASVDGNRIIVAMEG